MNAPIRMRPCSSMRGATSTSTSAARDRLVGVLADRGERRDAAQRRADERGRRRRARARPRARRRRTRRACSRRRRPIRCRRGRAGRSRTRASPLPASAPSVVPHEWRVWPPPCSRIAGGSAGSPATSAASRLPSRPTSSITPRRVRGCAPRTPSRARSRARDRRVAPSIWRSPASPRRWWQTSQMFAMPVAAIGWPFDSRPPETLTGVVPSRHVAPERKKSAAPPGSQSLRLS